METERICPSCHKPLPPDVPLGLCPECLIKAGVGTEAGGTPGPTFVPAPVEEIAKLFPQLEIIGFIGKGGMGAVYKARQPSLDRFVALKILPPTSASDPGFAERFNREARALARLNHPNIVMVHDFGRAGALHYLLMEFVDGGNLRQVEAAGRLAPEQALAIVPQICDALQYAHNEGIVHRDIKPENILLDKKGRVKITDFGIAKILGLTVEKEPLTGARDVMGTPHYMAPEQVEKPRTVDHRADIYSLGVVFYEMLTGELPLGKFAPPSRKVQVDVRLDEVVLHALEKEPELRYQQASQVKTAVENIATKGPGSSAEGATGTSPQQAENRPAADAEALASEILARDYALDVHSCVNRAWALVRSDFWPMVGVSALVLVLLSAVTSSGHATKSNGNTTVDTSILGFLLYGPLMGGLYFYFLRKIRGEIVVAQTAFSGFSKAFLQLLLTSFVGGILLGLAFVCLILPGIYLLVAWKFSIPLVIDQRFDFWTALKLSRKVINKHWWRFLNFLIVLLVLNFAGVVCLGVGLFVSFPVTVAALMYAYEDIFQGAGRTAAAQTALPVQPAGSPPQPTPLWQKLALLGLIILFLVVCIFVAFTPFSKFWAFVFAVAVALALFLPTLLLARQSGHRGFLTPFLVVFLGVFGTGSFLTSILPDSFASNAKLKLTPVATPGTGGAVSLTGTHYDPYLIQTEFETIQSEAILGSVIEDLDLSREWGRRFGTGQPLQPSQTLQLVKARLDVRPVRNASVIEIRTFSDNADEAARLANAIADSYCAHVASQAASSGSFTVVILEKASPGFRPVRPNRPVNLVLSALAGLVLGGVAGAVCGNHRPQAK
jgi:serine/threonine protein kinase